ncbi:transporter substrate-binding domain-containing protein [Roseicyclus sp. F158]|uniref:Transporter substrate-binding domain-containing protein n=1 Tax=Tropicimonas omnivorans TaxID=3075590 RepID=A0ABU3DCL3_9RHOB|nr:transporter substrate-binding domain-containing protein [Roseicyclus sp. F158]MDT0681298.1 transporter substrate-binding domain-containing protein [Roseicyclus sp. F158]
MRFALIVVALLGLAGMAAAQEDSGRADRPVRVGVTEMAPYATQTGDEAWMGLAPEIWRLIAEREGVAYDLVPLDPSEIVGAVEAGDVDLAMPVPASLSVLDRIDVSLPIHTAKLGLATPERSSILPVVTGLLSLDFLRVVLALSALLLAVGAVLWAIERRKNEEMFSRRPLRGLGDGFWWAGVTLTTIGYGDKAPITFTGRAVAMLWMLVGLAVSSALTATIVTLADTGGTNLSENLPGRTIGVIEGSNAEAFLEDRVDDLRPYTDMTLMLEALDAGDIEIAAGERLGLEASIDDGGFSFDVQATVLDPVMIGFGTAKGSDLSGVIDRVLLETINGEAGWRTLHGYVATDGTGLF